MKLPLAFVSSPPPPPEPVSVVVVPVVGEVSSSPQPARSARHRNEDKAV
jgi:hypothetical protein